MKSVKQILGIMLVAMTALTSCTKEDPALPLEAVLETPSAEDFKGIRDQALQDLLQSTTFNAEDGIVFTSGKGAVLTIAAGCLQLNGSAATGAAELTFVEAYDRGDMLTANKATMGEMPNGDMAVLISGGEFYINVKQNGAQLDPGCGISLVIPAGLTGGVDPEMILWDGNMAPDGTIVWEEDEGGANGQDNGVFGDGNEYYAYFSEFGWTNVDRFYNDPRPKTTLQVKIPDGYDDANSAVYLSYDGEPNALAQLDTFDQATSIFSEHYGQIPIGLEMHVIFVTEDDGQWKWAIKGVTVAANDIYVFTTSDLVTGTKEQLIAAINALP